MNPIIFSLIEEFAEKHKIDLTNATNPKTEYNKPSPNNMYPLVNAFLCSGLGG